MEQTSNGIPSVSYRFSRGVLLVLIYIPYILLCLIANIVQLVTLPFFPCFKPQMMRLHGRLAGMLWWILQVLFEDLLNAKFILTGDSIDIHDSAIVICNHVSFADFYMINHVARRAGTLSFCKYFAKDSIKYLPLIGWGMWMMGMILVKRNWMKDHARILRRFEAYRRSGSKIWLISFLEGSRIAPNKLRKSQEYSKENNLPVLQNVLVPRTKGFVASVEGLMECDVKWVYDLTIAYVNGNRNFQRPPSFAEVLFFGIENYTFYLNVKKYPFASLPKDKELLADWAIDRFVEKDRILEEIKNSCTKCN